MLVNPRFFEDPSELVNDSVPPTRRTTSAPTSTGTAPRRNQNGYLTQASGSEDKD
ncbi:hypothetical protein K7432_003704 [Basidiobolus ranarum]|uniref:Uncharacterized protein n=1 Tax=Basidiobolus ranarum TaxID=34480 RepID=A0ABR2WZG6_9FUNG